MVEQNTRGWCRKIQGDGLEQHSGVRSGAEYGGMSGAEYGGMVWSGYSGMVWSVITGNGEAEYWGMVEQNTEGWWSRILRDGGAEY